MSPELLEELYDVLQRPKFGLSADMATRWTELLESVVEIVPLPGRLHVLTRNADGNRVLECALIDGARWLATGNVRQFAELGASGEGTITYRGVRILSPRRFLTEWLSYS